MPHYGCKKKRKHHQYYAFSQFDVVLVRKQTTKSKSKRKPCAARKRKKYPKGKCNKSTIIHKRMKPQKQPVPRSSNVFEKPLLELESLCEKPSSFTIPRKRPTKENLKNSRGRLPYARSKRAPSKTTTESPRVKRYAWLCQAACLLLPLVQKLAYTQNA